MSDLQVFEVSRPGGINQSSPSPESGDLEELKNFAIYRNRVGLRAPLETVATIQDDQGSPQDVDAILDITDHQGKLWTLSWSSSQQDVYLHSMQVDGTSLTLEAVVHTTVVSQPVLGLVSFTGGTADVPEDRLYIFDYNQNLDTKYWEGSAITTPSADLDLSGSAENLVFSLMIPFKFHLFGTGFYEDGATRPELIRYSRPGLIADTDSSGGTPASKEWHTLDHISFGRRGDKIVALSTAGDRLLVFQKRALHVIYGSGRTTWTVQTLSNVVGCVGPFAVASIDEKVSYFWASDGPYRSDGSQLQYIGDPIRQLAIEVDAAETKTQVGYSPDDGLVHFIVSPGGEDSYYLDLIFDHRRDRWMKAVFLVGSDTEAEFGALAFLDSAAAPGPEGAPTSPSATASSDTQIDLTWTNGDVNVNTETHVYRSTSSAFTPNDSTNRIATLSSGVTSYSDTGLTADTTYYYKLRHFRNTSHSSESSEVNDTTWLAEPTGVGLAGLTDGLAVNGTNNAGAGADIVIQRKTSGGSFSTVQTLSTPGASFSWDDTGLTCGTEYFYRTKATEAGKTDSEWSAIVSREACDAASAPTAPSGLGATAVGETQIDLTWTDNSNNEDAFEVHRAPTSGGTFVLIATEPPNTTSYSDTGLDSNEDYYYKVRATNNAGDSAFTSEAGATTDPNLDAPADLAASNPTISTIDLAWTDTADDETSWEVHQSDTGSGGTYTKVATLGAGSTSYTATGLSAEREYHYKVRAVNGSTNGSFSNIANATTIGNAPAAPTGLTATVNGGSPTDTIDLAWTDNATTEENYEVQRKKGVGGSWVSVVSNLAVNTTSYQDTGLDGNTTYYYRVRAKHATNGDSDWSNEDNATTSGSETAPADPTNLVATPDDNDLNGNEVAAVDLTWDDNATNEDEYQVERCTGTSCTSWALVATLPANTVSYRDNVSDDPTANTIYRYRVRAANTTADPDLFSNYVTSSDVTVEPRAAASSVTAADQSFCSGSTPTPRIYISWSNGDVTGLETRKVERSVNGGAWTTLTTTPDSSVDHTDDTVEFGKNYRYRIVHDFGSTGENTGTFTSTESNTINPAEPDCGEEI